MVITDCGGNERIRRRRFAIHRLTIAALHVSDFDSAAHRRAEPPNTGLDPALVASLPTFTVGAKVLEGGGSAVECAVCLSALEGEEKAKLLPNCNHFFHVGCIDTWLSSHSTCPLCRAGIQPRLEPQNREGPVGLALDGAPAPFGLDSGTNGSGESSKINGSNSRLSSFRRVLSTERSSRRIQPSSHDEDDDDGVDLERQ
ncbi:E3 ubiquitin-protein ligase ATL41 [Spatholobus suberectus]|nr:E3 ubiquitin-protein ligase ATL41 [Spatholobus suberectus]